MAEVDHADPDDHRARPDRRRRGWRTVLAIVIGLLLGVGAAAVVPRLLDRDDGSADGSADDPASEAGRSIGDDDVVDSPEDLLDPDLPVPPGAEAPSAEAALRGFLDAEVARDFEASFRYLSAADRQRYGSPAGWVASHADVVPPVLGYELEPVSDGAATTTIAATMQLEPGLEQVTGLTPAEAVATWVVTPEPDGAWGVSLDASTTEPVYPSDEGAAAAARRWLEARRACEDSPDERGGLVGAVSLAETLCGADGDVGTGAVEPLPEAVGASISTAFGEEAATAARLVRTTGAVELGIVLAPVGDEWLVIGVVP